jgi:hypothetical protein
MKIEKHIFKNHFDFYCFNFSMGDQCSQNHFQISTLLCLASFISNLVTKGVEQQKSGMELIQKLNSYYPSCSISNQQVKKLSCQRFTKLFKKFGF